MNPFSMIVVITSVLLCGSMAFGIIAPTYLGLTLPAMPEFPSWASNLNWTVSLVDWSGIGSFFVVIGGIIVYGLSFIVYMFQISGVAFSVLGGFPSDIGTFISLLIGLALAGSVVAFLRGNSGETK